MKLAEPGKKNRPDCNSFSLANGSTPTKTSQSSQRTINFALLRSEGKPPTQPAKVRNRRTPPPPISSNAIPTNTIDVLIQPLIKMKPSAIHKASVGQCSHTIHLIYLTLLLQGTYLLLREMQPLKWNRIGFRPTLKSQTLKFRSNSELYFDFSL